MTDDSPDCPTCPDEGSVHEYGTGYTCAECGVVFHAGGSGVAIVGPRHPNVDGADRP